MALAAAPLLLTAVAMVAEGCHPAVEIRLNEEDYNFKSENLAERSCMNHENRFSNLPPHAFEQLNQRRGARRWRRSG